MCLKEVSADFKILCNTMCHEITNYMVLTDIQGYIDLSGAVVNNARIYIYISDPNCKINHVVCKLHLHMVLYNRVENIYKRVVRFH